MNRACESCEMQRCMMRSPMVTDCSRHKPKPKPYTNADRIRAMSDEELAEFITIRQERCDYCQLSYIEGACTETLCEDAMLKWLRQPAKDGEGDD